MGKKNTQSKKSKRSPRLSLGIRERSKSNRSKTPTFIDLNYFANLCRLGRYNEIKLLLENPQGAFLNKININGLDDKPLYMAVMSRNKDLTDLLITHSANLFNNHLDYYILREVFKIDDDFSRHILNKNIQLYNLKDKVAQIIRIIILYSNSGTSLINYIFQRLNIIFQNQIIASYSYIYPDISVSNDFNGSSYYNKFGIAIGNAYNFESIGQQSESEPDYEFINSTKPPMHYNFILTKQNELIENFLNEKEKDLHVIYQVISTNNNQNITIIQKMNMELFMNLFGLLHKYIKQEKMKSGIIIQFLKVLIIYHENFNNYRPSQMGTLNKVNPIAGAFYSTPANTAILNMSEQDIKKIIKQTKVKGEVFNLNLKNVAVEAGLYTSFLRSF